MRQQMLNGISLFLSVMIRIDIQLMQTGRVWTTTGDLRGCEVREFVAASAHLHLWTTNAFLFDCPRIFDAWGFTFRSSFVWLKSEIGLGNY
jgi:N6-adenosine-specific RNA methylase IME4